MLYDYIILHYQSKYIYGHYISKSPIETGIYQKLFMMINSPGAISLTTDWWMRFEYNHNPDPTTVIIDPNGI